VHFIEVADHRVPGGVQKPCLVVVLLLGVDPQQRRLCGAAGGVPGEPPPRAFLQPDKQRPPYAPTLPGGVHAAEAMGFLRPRIPGDPGVRPGNVVVIHAQHSVYGRRVLPGFHLLLQVSLPLVPDGGLHHGRPGNQSRPGRYVDCCCRPPSKPRKLHCGVLVHGNRLAQPLFARWELPGLSAGPLNRRLTCSPLSNLRPAPGLAASPGAGRRFAECRNTGMGATRCMSRYRHVGNMQW
jgi:hypothetical protein